MRFLILYNFVSRPKIPTPRKNRVLAEKPIFAKFRSIVAPSESIFAEHVQRVKDAQKNSTQDGIKEKI